MNARTGFLVSQPDTDDVLEFNGEPVLFDKYSEALAAARRQSADTGGMNWVVTGPPAKEA